MRTRKRRILKLWNTDSSKERRAYLKAIPKDKNGEEEKDDLVKEANRIIEENADIKRKIRIDKREFMAFAFGFFISALISLTVSFIL